MRHDAPRALVLAGVGLGAALLAALSGLTGGPLAGYALLAVGLMNSIMFPTIFSLGTQGLGDRTPQGSGLLCMGIVGGAIIPLLCGIIADSGTLSAALSIPIGCYIAISSYGWKCSTADA